MSGISPSWKPAVAALALLPLAACAGAPPSPPQAAAAGPQATAAAWQAHICTAKASYVTFASLGVPESDRPIDLVSTEHHDYVLFAPARLLRLSHEEGKVQVEVILGAAGEEWRALALDPTDGSLWVATEKFVLVHVLPSLHTQEVPIQRVAGSGGFTRLVVTAYFLYATPTCAADGVWRIDRNGRVVSSAFPVPHQDIISTTPLASCSMVRLDRDPEGHVVAWDWSKRELKRVDDQGEWRAVDGGIFAELPDPRTLKGVDLGTSTEQWYFTGAAGLFLWKGKPAFLGASTIRAILTGGPRPAADTVLLVPRPGGGAAREVIENCHGASIQRVATAGDHYAALAGGGIVLGNLTDAPDLP